MGLVSTFFENPVVKILEERLWETARRRYLGEHPADLKDSRAVMRRVKSAYRDTVAASLKEADQKVRASWGEFRQVMKEQLKSALSMVLHMSNVEWYSLEAGELPAPQVIAVPCQLLKQMTADLMPQFLRKRIDFENFDQETLEALATYAADQRFQEVLEEARRNHEPFTIGSQHGQFVIVEIIKRDAYFLGEDQHHSLVDMVILGSAGQDAADRDKRNHRGTLKKWFEEQRRNRRDDRRFTGDGWEIEPEEMRPWVIRS